MSNPIAEHFALTNGLDLDEVVDFFRGLDFRNIDE